MERAVKGDDALALGVVASQLHRGFHGLSTGVAVVSANRAGHGRYFAQALRQRDHAFVIKIGAGHVDQLGGLLLNCRHNFGVAMSGGNHGDAGGKIKEIIAINILNNHAAAALGHQRIGACVRRGNMLRVTLQDGLRLGAGQLGADLGTYGGKSLRCHVHPLFKNCYVLMPSARSD